MKSQGFGFYNRGLFSNIRVNWFKTIPNFELALTIFWLLLLKPNISTRTFTNVTAGIYTVFVKDVNGCGIVTKEVAVLGIPNYFTPNQDGFNDTWNIKGVNAAFNPKTIIQIFDRYGKLIKQISPIGNGWDGTFNGNLMPASDYWYSIQLENGKVMKGHFALKR